MLPPGLHRQCVIRGHAVVQNLRRAQSRTTQQRQLDLVLLVTADRERHQRQEQISDPTGSAGIGVGTDGLEDAWLGPHDRALPHLRAASDRHHHDHTERHHADAATRRRHLCLPDELLSRTC